MRSSWLRITACCGVLLGLANIAAAANCEIRLQRDRNLEHFASFEVHNTAAAPCEVKIETSLEYPDGVIKRPQTATYTVAPGATKTIPAYTDATEVRGEIALLRSKLTSGNEASQSFSAICGSAKPAPRAMESFLGMNVHLERYTAEEQWHLLQLMKAAGVQGVRQETEFLSPEADGSYPRIASSEQSVLAAEAFGMNSLMAITYFPGPYQQSPEKMQMAHDFAKAIGMYYKGRIHAWQFGNESNSGWGCYGAAADLAAHNRAMALGILEADPENLPSTLGIAEAHPEYLRTLFDNQLSPYLRAVTVHPYCGVSEAGIAKLLANRQVIREFGGQQQIWATEVGFHYHPGGGVNAQTAQVTQVNGFTLEQQADLLARLYLLGRAKGIDRIYWYDFFGKNDEENFWLVDADYKPRPAYDTLKLIGNRLAHTTPLGGTAATEVVQRQMFRRPDGSVFLAAWSVVNGVATDLHLPPGQYIAQDTYGKPVTIEAGKPVVLGERPILIDGLPRNTASFDFPEILISALDNRTWQAAQHRWAVDAGAKLTIPLVVYNPTAAPAIVTPVMMKGYPGWSIELPTSLTVLPGQTVNQPIVVTVPPNAVPGVEYQLSFAGETIGPRRTLPFEARIWVNGTFPYGPLLADHGTPAYPTRRPFNEAAVGTGRHDLTARHGSATADGDLSEWNPEEFVPLDQIGAWILRDVGYPSRQDWTARAAIRWAEKALHAAFIVLDDNLSELDFTSRDWRDSDNIHLFLSFEEEAKRGDLPGEKEFLIFMAPTGPFQNESPRAFAAAVGGYLHKGFETKVTLASRVWNGGYLLEVTIPFEAMGVAPKAGMTLGCNILGDDADHGYRRYSGMTWFKDGTYWNSPKSLGTLTLLPPAEK